MTLAVGPVVPDGELPGVVAGEPVPVGVATTPVGVWLETGVGELPTPGVSPGIEASGIEAKGVPGGRVWCAKLACGMTSVCPVCPAAPVVFPVGAREQLAERQVARAIAAEDRDAVGRVAVLLVGEPEVAAEVAAWEAQQIPRAELRVIQGTWGHFVLTGSDPESAGAISSGVRDILGTDSVSTKGSE